MENAPDTDSSEHEPRQSIGRLGALGRRVREMAMFTGLGLMAVLGGCVEDEEPSQKEKIERCFDPSHNQRYPLRQNYFVALAIHIVLNGDGTSNMSIDHIKENIDDIRRVYKDIILDFYVTSVKFANSSLQPGVIPGETRGEYEGRLKDYIEQHGTADAVDVIYTPGWFGKNGSYIQAEGEEFIILYTDDDGRTVVKKTLPHEIGHILGLKHPFDVEGDKIADTPNYEQDCPAGAFRTYMVDDTCMVACNDGTLALPTNLMDENICRGDVGQMIQTDEGLTYSQLSVGNCVLQSAKSNYINPNLPEVDL